MSLCSNGLDITQVRPVTDKVKVFLISVGPMDISGDLFIIWASVSFSRNLLH